MDVSVKDGGRETAAKPVDSGLRLTLLAGFLFYLLLLLAADGRDFTAAELRLADMNKGTLGELFEQVRKEPVAPLPVALLARGGVLLAGPTEAGVRLPFLLLSAAALALLLPFAWRATRCFQGTAAVLAAAALFALRVPALSSAAHFPLQALLSAALLHVLYPRLLARSARLADVALTLAALLAVSAAAGETAPDPAWLSPEGGTFASLLLLLSPAAFFTGRPGRRVRLFDPAGAAILLFALAFGTFPDARPPLSALPGWLAVQGFSGAIHAAAPVAPLLSHGLKGVPARIVPLPAAPREDVPPSFTDGPGAFALAASARDFEGALSDTLRGPLSAALAARRATGFFRARGGAAAPALLLFGAAAPRPDGIEDAAGLFTGNHSGREPHAAAARSLYAIVSLFLLFSLCAAAFGRARP